MKKIIPVLLILSVLLGGCSLLQQDSGSQTLSDAEMATRVAELLATMTTPTEEILFPATPTVGLPTVIPPTTTPVVVTTEPPVEETPEVTTEPVVTSEVEVTVTPEPTGTTAPTATLPAGDPINRLGEPTGFDLEAQVGFTYIGRYSGDEGFVGYGGMKLD